ncbi:hypothetical protein GQ43DRAFT_450135 [Delitschia confertaspora ATCC 74209]|uniref:Zn(2)-C6 fungal-type domain-containing protein n=1 Tax=Delitschia confertaspora ATCC 74209 TaxID=1513339 RepID=A0A9P4JMP7_9PLEO|nr:hypothetical protein GQ43DRAFT_450135 [Delitschia confertaspora ATCC 74209]
MRSRTGCLTCRHRKLKCDEKKPICGQCTKANRECVPSSGIVFRHQHNASMNGDGFEDENNLKGFYAYKDTFDGNTIWVDIPKQVTFLHTTNPYTDPLTPESEAMSPVSKDSLTPPSPSPPATFQPSTDVSMSAPIPATGDGMEPFPAFINDLTPPILPPPAVDLPMQNTVLAPIEENSVLQPLPMSSIGTPSSLPSTNLSSIPTNVPSTPPSTLPSPLSTLSTRLSRSSSLNRQSPSLAGSDCTPAQDHEMAFLLRHFSEGPGSWMDLFDLGNYFASYIPVKARENSLLKYAAVSCSAKALARVQGKKVVLGRSVSRQARTELYPDAQAVNWYHKATQYYDTAVSLLLQALKNGPTVTPGAESGTRSRGQSMEGNSDRGGTPACKRRRTNSSTLTSYTEDLLAATAILGVYENMDASIPEWVGHLNGAKSILVNLQQRTAQLQIPSTLQLSYASLGFTSKASRATFWNIARQDMLAAFINNTRTRIDPEDYTLWNEAGLVIDSKGFVFASNTGDTGYPDDEDLMTEDMICNSLVWLMSRLVNFIACGSDLAIETGAWTGQPQFLTRLEYWNHLQQQFEAWYDGLPDSFQPSARVDPSHMPGRLMQEENDCLFSEVWYSIPMCASTMQFYHMSQILLLMNKPAETPITDLEESAVATDVANLNDYQSVLATAQAHSCEIVSISLSRSDEAVRIHSIQPLYTAGQCLGDVRERQVVIKLLRDIEADTGWVTEYRVRQLMEQWQFEDAVTTAALPGANMVEKLKIDEVQQANDMPTTMEV